MSTLEIIVEELKTLSPKKLEEAVALIHGLREKSHAERLAALERSASILSETEGLELERIIGEPQVVWPSPALESPQHFL